VTLEDEGTAIIQNMRNYPPSNTASLLRSFRSQRTCSFCVTQCRSSKQHEKGTTLPVSSVGIPTAQPNDINDIMPNGLNFDVYDIWLDESSNRVFTEQQSHVHVWVFWNFRVLISIF